MRIFVLKKSTIIRAAVFVLLFAAAICFTQFVAIGTPAMAPAGELAPVSSFDTDQKQVALTIDTAFGDDYTGEILDVLKQAGVPATFFVMGAWGEQYPDKVKDIAMAGCDINSHSYAHKKYTDLSPEEIADDVKVAGDYFKTALGRAPTLIRPPYGAYDDMVIETLESNGLTAVKWDVDSKDWKREGVEKTVANVLEYVKPGSIVMFQNNIIDTPAALKQVILKLSEQGYEFVHLSDALAARRGEADQTKED